MTDDDLIKSCLGKNTQNNECYNKILWAIILKQTFTGKEAVELSMHTVFCLAAGQAFSWIPRVGLIESMAELTKEIL